jgi:hypothetical protein
MSFHRQSMFVLCLFALVSGVASRCRRSYNSIVDSKEQEGKYRTHSRQLYELEE